MVGGGLTKLQNERLLVSDKITFVELQKKVHGIVNVDPDEYEITFGFAPPELLGLHRHRVGLRLRLRLLASPHLLCDLVTCERLLLHVLLPASDCFCICFCLPASTSASDCLTDFISALLLTIVLHQVEKGLSEAFSQYGQVIEAQIVSDRVSERSKGFGFVTFASEDEAHKALEKMNGKPLNGRVIFVDYAKPRTNYGSGMPIARGPPDSIKDG
ncbi:uncharacterized protein LOC126584341 [Malus sylvestris]|uniref:uncharacterized protein LOC126584341 n=1 Tax=Malus sylvestris TaxID=3752 RepID=UPI0021AC4876|nr:uncharacterized protein LOC126584341 [Malus sylvestris]